MRSVRTLPIEREPPSVLATKDQGYTQSAWTQENGIDSDASQLVSTQDGKSSSAFASNWSIMTSPVSLASQSLREGLAMARKTILPYCDCS